MERGKLAFDYRPATVFVFDGLIGELRHPRLERVALATHKWDRALEAWEFNYKVLDFMYHLMSRYQIPVEVVTWRPHEFAEVVGERLWKMDVPVRSVKSERYESLSPRIAIDGDIDTVYDTDPTHRMGYGFKWREVPIR